MRQKLFRSKWYKINGFKLPQSVSKGFANFDYGLGLRFAIVLCLSFLSAVYHNFPLLILAGVAALFPSLRGRMEMLAIGAQKRKIQVDKQGLTGANLQLFEEFERRMGEIPESLSPEEFETRMNTATEPFKTLLTDEVREMLLDKDKGLRAQIVAQGLLINELKANQSNQEQKTKSVRAMVTDWVEQNKESIKALKNNQRADLKPLQIRAAITMTEGTSLNSSVYLPNPQILPGVIDLIRVQPTFWSRLNKPATKANPLIWVNKKNKQGNAQFIAEGVLKPLASFELATESSTPKKVAERMKVSTEMLDDIDYLTGLITGELQYEVDTASNQAVLTGDGISPNPKGITLYGAAYSLVSITGVIAPNNSDAIRAAIAQLRSINVNGPLTAFINPIDAAVMDLQKNTQGSYVLAPFTTADGRNIAATPVIEDNNIAVGYLLLGDMNKYHIQMYQDFFVQWGWENDDFSKNLVTVIGERRFHQWVSDNEKIAFVYDTFANIKTAIS